MWLEKFKKIQSHKPKKGGIMKKWMKVAMVITVLAVMVMVGCKDEVVEPELTESEILVEYLIAQDLDLTDILSGWIITAFDVHENLGDYYVIDVRSQEKYDLGHIPGAVWADASNILEVAADNGGKTIVVHCYKGIGATKLVTALRLSGFPTAMSMKFGMSAWGLSDAAEETVVYDKWTSACSDAALEYPADWLLTATTPAEDTEYNYPIIETGEEAGADILAARVATLLTDGYDYASAPDILTLSDDYFINNYWDEDSWNKYGHIKGAHRINSLSLETGGINNLDSEETIVTYCWTSQTSGMITAYLTVLGYDAQSLMTGANGMIYSNLATHAWGLGENVNPLVDVVPGKNAPGVYELEATQ